MSAASVFSDYIKRLNPMYIPSADTLSSITSAYMTNVEETQRMGVKQFYLQYFEIHKVYMKFIDEFIDATTKSNCKNYGLEKTAKKIKISVVSVHDAMRKHYDAKDNFMMELSDFVQRNLSK